MTSAQSNANRHPAQWLALAIGIVYTLVGVAGFFITGFDRFVNPEGELLIAFSVNPLHNLIHVAIGVAGLALWKRLASARGYGWILAIAYLPTFLYGLFVAGSEEPANFLALNTADNWLHILSALAGLGIALWPARDHEPAQQRRTA